MFFGKKGLLRINKENITIPYIGVIKWSEIDKMLLLEYSKLFRRENSFLCIVPKDYKTILSRLKPVRRRDVQYRARLFGIQGVCVYLLGCSDSSLDELCQKISHLFKPVEKKIPNLSGLSDI
ncbi:MAG: hypothetical protein AABZ65_01865 [Candidatus Omnitrophota bacterium]